MNQLTVNGYANNVRSGETRNGNTWCAFSLKNSEYAGKDENGESRYADTWFDVMTYDYVADRCKETLDSDDARIVTVMGRLEQREYETKEGEKRKAFSLIGREVIRGDNLSSFGATAGGGGGSSASAPSSANVPF